MQIRDELTDGFGARYSRKAISLDPPKSYPAPMRVVAVILAWLVPGAGHFVLGKLGRGILFLVLICGSFGLGLLMHGRLYAPWVADQPQSLDIGSWIPAVGYHLDPISVLWSFAQAGAGLCQILAHALGFASLYRPGSPTYEYGNTFMFLAGLLNYLVIHDAFDIAAGRKR